jgi:hypothetical protein
MISSISPFCGLANIDHIKYWRKIVEFKIRERFSLIWVIFQKCALKKVLRALRKALVVKKCLWALDWAEEILLSQLIQVEDSTFFVPPSFQSWNMLKQVLLINKIFLYRFTWGPLPGIICTFNAFLKTAATVPAIIFFDGMVISKYFLIFWLKNPYSFHDDFWNRFISIWTISFSHLSQFVADFMPGNRVFLVVSKNIL